MSITPTPTLERIYAILSQKKTALAPNAALGSDVMPPKKVATRPQDLVKEVPVFQKQGDRVEIRGTSYIVNMNRKMGPTATLLPYKDEQHPDGRFDDKETALDVAKKLFSR